MHYDANLAVESNNTRQSTGYFDLTQGARQGDPIFANLPILIQEILQALYNHSVRIQIQRQVFTDCPL